MPEHKLPIGLQVINDLEDLAEALGYTSEREYQVGRTRAAVDLAWFGAGDQRVPLMIFEVESSASSSMANNALKVFSQDVDDFVKPLFFFHILLRGGPDNERIESMRQTWGRYNYRVYRLNAKLEAKRLIADIISQHRRISMIIDPIRLWASLHNPSWRQVNMVDAFAVAESLCFSANYRRDLTLLAAADPQFQPLLLSRLHELHVSGNAFPGSYGTYLGTHFAAIFEISLLVGTGTISDDDGRSLLIDWQRGRWGLKMIAPSFGLNHDYDEFIVSGAPLVFSVAALLCRDGRLTKAWLAKELAALVAGEDKVSVRIDFITAARLWLLHITASVIRDYSLHPASYGEADLHELYKSTQSALSSIKTPLALLFSPPSPSELTGEDAEPLPIATASAGHLLVGLPSWDDLDNGYFPEAAQDNWSDCKPELTWRDSFGLTASILTSDDWIAWPTNDLVRLLHREPFPLERSQPDQVTE